MDHSPPSEFVGPNPSEPDAPGVAAPRAPLDADLSGDLPCVVCRYNLRGLSILSICPECGTRIRATILAHVDPHAAELRPVRAPWLLAASILLWAIGAAAAALLCWVPQIAAIMDGFGGRKTGGGVDVGVVATTAVALSGLGAAGLLAPQRPTPRSGTIATAVAVLAYAPLAVAVWQAAQFTASGEIGVLGPWPPLTGRTLWRLLAGAMIAVIALAMRPNARLLVARSLVLRTGRVDRQTLLALAAAAALWMAGDLLVLGLGHATGLGGQIGRIVAIVLIVTGSILVTIGCFGGVVDAVRIAGSILRPAPALDQLVTPPAAGDEERGAANPSAGAKGEGGVGG